MSWNRASWVSCIVALAAAAAGCGGDDGGSTTSGGGSAASSGTSSDPGDHATCDQYVLCIAAINPGLLGTISEQYTEDGTCWSDTPELCDVACAAGLRQSHDAFPDEQDCPVCVADRNCDEGLERVCRADGMCVECVSDAECLAACDLQTNTCLQCVSDADCTGPNNFCSPQHQCLACNAPGGPCCVPDPNTCSFSSACEDEDGFSLPPCGVHPDATCGTDVDCGTCSPGAQCENGCCFEVEDPF